MASPFQAAPLVACPSYPNSIAWSDENLVAIATGHLISILNPALLSGPRGLITIPPNKLFPIGLVSREDLFTGCLLPTCLSRDTRPCARSISWSHLGLAPNSGCLLAVCTTEGSVKLYRQPFSEFRAEWVEVIDISDLLFDHLVRTDFGEADMPSIKVSCEQVAEYHRESGCASHLQHSMSNKRQKQRMVNISCETGTLKDQVSHVEMNEDANGGFTPPNEKQVTSGTEIATFPCLFEKNTLVEVLKQNGAQHIWLSGKIKRTSGAKVLVQYPETGKSGEKDEWVELNIKCDKIKGSDVQNGINPDHSAPSPKIRPYMDVGNLPERNSLLEFHDLEGILSNGQAVEAWLDDRWVEGSYMGLNEHGLLVKLSGVNDSVTLDAKSIRLAPLWDCGINSWRVTLLKIGLEELDSAEVVQLKSKKLRENIQGHGSSVPKHEETSHKKRSGKETITQITVKQYASRNAMLSSTIVAWSPVLQLSSESDCSHLNSLPRSFSFLSVGGKSGKISFWRIHKPQRYTIVNGSCSADAVLVGFLQAHNRWITAICWEIFYTNGSKSQVVLTTGSSDGSVKIWLVDTEGLVSSSEINCSSICLLKEVTSTSSAPVSVISITAPAESPGKMLLAVGRGSGSLEVWTCDLSSCEFQISGSYDAHVQVVTGLIWAFSGRCLYSCSQDDSVRSWVLHGRSLYEVPIPSISLGLQISTDLPYVSDSCFGLAISPGNLVVAVVRGFDADFLNPMYQARTQKAAIEFFWIGGQQLGSSSDRYLEFGTEAFPDFPEREMRCWESNVLWSLKQYEHVDKLLVVWDVIAAFFAFKHSAQSYTQCILVKWLSSWVAGCDEGFSIDKILFHASRFLSKIPSRQLHLLNIICRRFVLSGLKADMHSGKENKLEGVAIEDEKLQLWNDLLNISERELRERLVAYSFAVVLSQVSSSATVIPVGRHWLPVGIAQMEQWVATNHDKVQDRLQLLASKIKNLGRRLHSECGYLAEEQCRFCSALVPFESPEVAFCVGERCNNGVLQSHKLVRCAVSMQICPTTPLWYCVCCQRSVSEMVPQSLFTISEFPSDLESLIGSSFLEVISRPLCPFCGILLQRLQPEFLLSASPV